MRMEGTTHCGKRWSAIAQVSVHPHCVCPTTSLNDPLTLSYFWSQPHSQLSRSKGHRVPAIGLLAPQGEACWLTTCHKRCWALGPGFLSCSTSANRDITWSHPVLWDSVAEELALPCDAPGFGCAVNKNHLALIHWVSLSTFSNYAVLVSQSSSCCLLTPFGCLMESYYLLPSSMTGVGKLFL